jgi:hypothetical protein
MKSGSAILTPILFRVEPPGNPFIKGRREFGVKEIQR